MKDLIRTSIRLTPEMHEWYKEEASKIGIPMNAMIIFALKQYQREEDMLPNIPDIIQAMRDSNKLSLEQRREDGLEANTIAQEDN